MKRFKRNIKILFSLLFCPILLYSQCDSTFSIEELMKAVVYLQDEKPKNDSLVEISYGTGFFVRNDNNIFLVTAEHIARKLINNPSLITSDKNGNSTKYSLNSKMNWKYNSFADAAATIIADPTLIKVFENYAIDFNFIEASLTYPVAELPLVVIGFPLRLGSQGKFSPLRRETNAASALIDLPRADNKIISTFFILQDPSIGGYSGAPVFVIEAYSFGNTLMKGFGTKMCIGLMHGTMLDDTGGKLGLVVPSKYIYDLVK